jgi:hypothetical protein
MIAAGALAFRRSGDAPKTYKTIGREIGYPLLAEEARNDRLNAMEDGAKQWLGLQLIRNAQGRCFVETMLAQSGMDVGVLEVCAEAVRTGWSWPLVARSALADVEAFIEARRGGFALREGLKALLQEAEGLRAVADRLIELARFRESILERGLVRSGFEDTRAAIVSSGLSAKAFLGTDLTDALLRSLLEIGRSAEDEVSTPRWRWVAASETAYGLGLSLPRRMEVQVPIEVDRLRLVATDSRGLQLGGPAGEAEYMRSGNSFRRTSQASCLLARAGCEFPVQMSVRFREGAAEREVLLDSLSRLREPVTLLHAGSGEQVDSAPPGTSVILLVAPGWTLESSEAELQVIPGMAVEVRRATVPAEPAELRFTGPLGEEASWLLGNSEPLRLKLRVDCIEGLRFEGAPAVSTWPTFEVFGAGRAAETTLSLPSGGMEATHSRLRNGVLKLEEKAQYGRYSLRVAVGGRWAQTRFVLLPPAASFVVQEEPAQADGTVATRASVAGIEADLRPTDAEAIREGGSVLFPQTLLGKRTIGIAAPRFNLQGSWTVMVEPMGVQLLDSQGAKVESPWDLSVCDAASKIVISGSPGTAIELEFGGKRIQRHLALNGFCEVRLVEMASSLRESDAGRITVGWEHQATREYRFVNQLLTRPTETREDGQVLLQSRRRLKEPVAGELLPVWQPWLPYQTQPARYVERNGKHAYAVALPSTPGGYMVALTEQGRPATGMMLAIVEGEAPDLSHPLSALLWEKGASVQAMVEALRAQPWELTAQIAEQVERYGPSFFRVERAFASAAGRTLLHRVVENPGSAEDCALGRLLRRSGHDLTVARYSDLDEVAESATRSDDVFLAALDALAGKSAGLLLAALKRWCRTPAGADNQEHFQAIISPMIHLTAGKPARLSVAETDLVITPDDPATQLAAGSSLGPRVQGLLQARSCTCKAAFESDEGLRKIRRRYPVTVGAVGDWEYRAMAPPGVPPAVVALEELVAACTRDVHRWRCRGADLDACKNACELAQHVGTLVDYWLNYWACNSQQ